MINPELQSATRSKNNSWSPMVTIPTNTARLVAETLNNSLPVTEPIKIAINITTPQPAIILNGVWTIKNNKTANHRTFKIKTLPNDEKTGKQSRLVLLLVGSDNENNYKPFGFVSERGDQIFVFKKYRAEVTDKKKSDWEVYARMLEDLFIGKQIFINCELIGSASCLRCNRLLTTPESVERNYGPECWEKIGN